MAGVPLVRIILYLPYNAAPRGQWIVRRNADLAGQFATREDAFRHARQLLAAIRAQPGHHADLKIEDENGNWRYSETLNEAVTGA
ncbi:DUF2188 domain-containing protein [Luteibacter aegosomaticola]|uniref:DUF2188 domain-containing protein n=1 Tax=Luteibacter aegosomaticola TaxID=2911538 RepID=UPI001FF933C0|nr:DUF2188 domain-containing protein [Luteibacter aegosomaticola]UPG87986.1 DUF2188 domain-containing protein [Luteibacter aegosomaticola]